MYALMKIPRLIPAALLLGVFVAGGAREAAPPPVAGKVQCKPTMVGSVCLNGQARFHSDAIYRGGPWPWHWLSLPESRLVLNPGQVEGPIAAMGSNLGLSVGYWVASQPSRIEDLLFIDLDKAGEIRPTTIRQTWRPYALGFQAQFPSARVSIRGTDFLPNQHVVARIVRVQRKSGDLAGLKLVLGGNLSDGATCRWIAAQHMLLIIHRHFCYVVRLCDKTGATLPDAWLGEPLITPKHWRFTMAVSRSFTVVETVGFATGVGQVVEHKAEVRAAACWRGMSPRDRLSYWHRKWNDILARVPAPEKFGPAAGLDLGISAARHRAAYYAAWTFLISDVLPPMPENGFDYPQVATGKPSLWAHGAPHCQGSSSWESFLGQQFLGYVMPKTAWQCYAGLLSRVNSSGALGGESLPSRAAQTAWILYSLTGDKSELSSLYPVLRRRLLWCERHPRWMFPGVHNRHSRDSDFVVSVMVDMRYAEQIARTLHKSEDVRFWQQERSQEMARYAEWFFPPEGDPIQVVVLSGHGFARSSGGNLSMILTGLHLHQLNPVLANRLKELFLRKWHPLHPLKIYGDIKYPDLDYMVYGLFVRGLSSYAHTFLNDCLANTIRAGDFSETFQADPPRNGGVTPSLFGVCLTINFTWLENNMRMDKGPPEPFAMPR